jgi:hypothetical protein
MHSATSRGGGATVWGAVQHLVLGPLASFMAVLLWLMRAYNVSIQLTMGQKLALVACFHASQAKQS